MGEIVQLGERQEDAAWSSGDELAHGATQVWAISVMGRGERAHFWYRSGTGYWRECDGATVPAFMWNGQSPLFGPGGYPKCLRCVKILGAK